MGAIRTKPLTVNRLGTIIFLALIVGVVLRIVVYSQNRSLIMDEANLARNIVEKNYSDFFKPLDYEQYAPPLFSCTLKSMTAIFGVNEYSLRVLSLLSGIASLFLMFLIARALKINGLPLLYVLLLYGLSTLAIRYSSELKQYSFDTFLCLLFLCWTLKKINQKVNFSYAIQLSICGAVAVWTSMPIVFVLASIGTLLLYKSIVLSEVKFSQLFLIGASWLFSFSIYFFLILKSDANSDYLQNFHSRYFFDFLPTDSKSLYQNFSLLLGIFRSIMDKTTVSLLGGFVFFGIGSYHLFKQNKWAACLLILPFLFCLIASHFGMYSLLERLCLFFIPFLTLVFGFGFWWSWKYSKTHIKVILLLFAVLSLINKKGYTYLWNKLEIENSKAMLMYLHKNKHKQEPILVHHTGVPAFVFYNEMHDAAFKFDSAHLYNWNEILAEKGRQDLNLKSGDTYWMFFSHAEPIERLQKDFQAAQKTSKLLDEERAVQSIVQRYQKK